MMTYKTRPIGEVFELEVVKLQVVEDIHCKDCFFCGDYNCFNYINKTGYCGKSLRDDRKSVIFKRINNE